MADYYKLSGSANRHTDWTTEVVLSRDENGEPDKVVSADNPVQLTAEERSKVEALGYSLESASKSEAEAAPGAPEVTDVTGTAPVFGVSDAEMRPASDRESGGSKSKSNDNK